MRKWLRGSFRNRMFAAMLLTALAPLLLGGALMLRLQVQRTESGLARQAELQLEDLESALDELCAALDADREELVCKLEAVGYTYDPEKNRFL